MLKTIQPPSELHNKVSQWINGPIDENTKKEIQYLIEHDQKLLMECFSSDLSFGTSGLRGLMGVGTNRINQYTVAKATQGLVNYFQEKKKNSFVVIAYDNRKDSHLFACTAAQVLAAGGIHVYIFEEIRPSPFLSFIVCSRQCDAGIMITASHNPKEYNGYEVYGPDGGEISSPLEEEIQNHIKKITTFDRIHKKPLDHTLIEWIKPEIWDVAYLSAIRSLQHYSDANSKYGASLKILYSSLHGTGITLIPKALHDWGFHSIEFVKEQIFPDPEFPTIKYPNPGDASSLALGIAQLQKSHSDLFIANDCDADRIGIVVMHNGEPKIFNGNEFATLCAYHICTANHRKPLSVKGAFIITFVTTELIKAIASSFNIACFEVPTGFKYIAEKIHEWELNHNYQFLFGAEESCGCLLGTYTRNKDGIAAAALISEIALHAKQQKLTLVDLLHKIYLEYGIFREKLHSINFEENEEGFAKRTKIMEEVRKSPPKQIGNHKVILMEDYLNGFHFDFLLNKKEKTTFPYSDMVLFRLDDDSKVILRPSGTEGPLRVHVACKIKEFTSVEEGILLGDHHIDYLFQSLLELIKCVDQK